MAVERGTSAGQATIKTLRAQEIDRRIERLTSQLAAQGGEAERDAINPRLIAPGELVRLLQRFVVYN